MKTARHAFQTGAALAVTVGVAYAACSVVFWLFPESSASFMTALFHGVDFTPLLPAEGRFTFGGFAFALVVLTAWVFLLGALFGWVRDKAAAL